MSRKYYIVAISVFLLFMMIFGCGQKAGMRYKDLMSDDLDVKVDMIIELGNKKKADAVPDLIKLLDSESDERAKVEAIRALGKIGDPAAIKVFKRLINDNLDTVRISLAYVMGMIKSPESISLLEQLMKDRNENVRNAAVVSIGKINDPSVIPLLIKISIYDESEDVRDVTLRIIGQKADKSVIPLLENAALSETDTARAHAAFALGRLGDPSSVPTLVKTLGDPVPEVRGMTLLALSKLKTASCVPAIKKMMSTEKESLVLVEAGWALCRLGDQSGKEVLRDYLFKGMNIETRAEAAKALADIGDVESIPLLQKALNDRSGLVQYEVQKALVKLSELQQK